ncbi:MULTISPECIES: TonB-dependent receptor [unclassified Novosphingobium]|uniref:TonB-dependent receptor n=1 Tax=unclassified Novosphingobium TaxID=2644732 RepID=UPI0014949F37|nr:MULTISPECIES: TonB-dependent receptor [unclassified Novosphingobium]MBB3358299.1 iron complex outermembrane receptor protein [Novosphingobium sp. BK256]MBB3374660.1 iron complex outermembrane receptor protein [Novosphingobium sp. BK280]MBB3379072.1 iron complex outermembrane receptor protein [Novosphingobium sp. BK258]MBB3420766.1 iron complex outermembrane receptor protein [Novosphingobium sp. BK267]MBB3448112.1 iron complex outermembrane receptor protein [Novosphingobium sp. BK352]
MRTALSFKGLLLTGAGLAILTASPSAYAQNASAAQDEAATDGLQVITVTAQRRSENLQSTPVAVTAFTGDSLKTMQVSSVLDMAQHVPNVSFTSALASSSSVAAFIRGAGQANAGFAFTDSAVGFYVDDVYHARLSGTNLLFNDIDRIEVLRGPQGTLYGRNNLTGAVKVVRKQADGTTFGSAEGSYGSRDYNDQKATFSTAIAPDKLAVIVSGFHQYKGDYYDAPAIGGKRGKDEQYGARVGLAWIGDGPFSAKANVSYTHEKGDGAAQINFTEGLKETGGAFGTYISPIPSSSFNEQINADLTLGYDFDNGLKLKAITGYIRGDDRFRFDVYGGQVNATTGAYTAGFDRRSDMINHQFSQELQLSGDVGGNVQFILGGYYFHETIRQVFNDNVLGYQVLPDTIHQVTNSYAGFGQATWRFAPRFSLTLGGRYTRETKDIDATLSNGLFLPSQTLTAVGGHLSFTNFSPKGEIDFQATRDIFIYASISRGFQSGGFNASVVANPTLFNTPYGAETVTAYEAGMKSEFFDHHLRVNADWFVNRFGEIQTNTYIGTSVVTQNAGTALVHGPELEVTAEPVHGLTLFGNGSLTLDKYLKLNANTAAARANADALPRVSKWQYNIGFNARHSLGGEGMGTLHASSSLAYRSSYNVDPGLVAISQMPAQTLLNAAVGWTSDNGKLDVTLSADNLTNNRFYVTGSNYGVNRKSRLQNEPRLVKIAVSYKL